MNLKHLFSPLSSAFAGFVLTLSTVILAWLFFLGNDEQKPAAVPVSIIWVISGGVLWFGETLSEEEQTPSEDGRTQAAALARAEVTKAKAFAEAKEQEEAEAVETERQQLLDALLKLIAQNPGGLGFPHLYTALNPSTPLLLKEALVQALEAQMITYTGTKYYPNI